MTVGTPTAVDVETYLGCLQFLTYEAELLDDNRLRDWLDLLHPDIEYTVPIRLTRERAAGPGFSTEGWHMNENYSSLETRVARLETEYAWAEDPPSRTRRYVTNVRAQAGEGSAISVKSNMLLVRGRYDAPNVQLLSSERRDVLEEVDGKLRLRTRLVLLDHSTLGTPNLGIFL